MNHYQVQYSAYNGLVFATLIILEEAISREDAIYAAYKQATEFIKDRDCQITLLSATELPKPK